MIFLTRPCSLRIPDHIGHSDFLAGSASPRSAQEVDEKRGNVGEVEEKATKRRKTTRKAEEQTPLTPVDKAKDICAKLLKKKAEASNLGLTLQTVPYAEALSSEMAKFASQFEHLGCVLLRFTIYCVHTDLHLCKGMNCFF